MKSEMKEIILQLTMCAVTTCTYISYVPQIYKLLTTREAEDLSVPSWILWSITGVVNSTYSIILGRYELIIASVSELVLILSTLFLTIKFRKGEYISMTKEQENIINDIKRQIEKSCRSQTFRFDESHDEPITIKTGEHVMSMSEPRYPNENDIRDWMKNKLKSFYVSNPDNMSAQQYRSEKGKLRRKQYEEFINFMKNRDVNITEELEIFKSCKCFSDASVSIKFSIPIITETIQLATIIPRKDSKTYVN